jgi:hypothetical protein
MPLSAFMGAAPGNWDKSCSPREGLNDFHAISGIFTGYRG